MQVLHCRCSTSKAFLRPASRRNNLDIVTGAHVEAVLFERDGESGAPRAVGVRYQREGRLYSVRASREVVLSAGTINTPQILMLSGVGPASHLRHHGIPVLADLPVGYNLQDHYGSLGLVATLEDDISLNHKQVKSQVEVIK